MKSWKEFRIQGGGQGCRDVEMTEDGWCTLRVLGGVAREDHYPVINLPVVPITG